MFGVQADVSAADLRGENTCFSGIGGVNCHHIVNTLSTAAGRVGFAWDRSLAYAKAGGAWANTTYNVFGNTYAVTLGTGSSSIATLGWVAGAGLEYALTNNWTTLFEYDHVDVGTATVPFPTVAVVNTQTTSVKQTIDSLKLGVNYKFGLDSTIFCDCQTVIRPIATR